MRKTLLIAAGGAALAAAASVTTLARAERMSPNEIRTLRACERAAADAEAELAAVKAAIARAHGMRAESWMEWEAAARIDGDFILFYHTNFMR